MKRLLVAAVPALAVAFLALLPFAFPLLAGVFTESFTGAPSAPIPFTSNHWEIAVHTQEGSIAPTNTAQHGPNCEPPGETGTVTHVTSTYAELAFQCSNHMMTHLSGDLSIYSAIYATPDQMVDLSSGTATIQFDISTLATSTRDWPDVWIQGWDTQEQRILDSDIPTNHDNPRNAIHVEAGGGCCSFRSGEGQFHVEQYSASRARVSAIPGTGRWIDVLTPSAVTRSTIRIDFTPGHIRVWMPQFGLTLAEGSIAPLDFTQGLVSFGHHSYSPEKGAEGGNLDGRGDTWHWDEITIDPAVPFTILNSDHRSAGWDDTAAQRTFSFGAAPANAVLRFSAMSEGTPTVSFNGGAPESAPSTSGTGSCVCVENPRSFLVPVPEGATSATITIQAVSGNHGDIQNPTVFAKSGATPTPTATPTATPTPTPTASATPTPTPTATPTPSPRTYRCQVKNLNNNNYTTVWTQVGGGSCP